ncbi:TRAP transporter small permease subunit [Labrenzia sp. CE80]|uniref:TRAP transporter small permease subunit n=1 Tax=Labrenzia sp. CE80 TaxID=1788986 RepID=UPI00129B6276|nr:TRAP transporter small permease subunit [Labrenzia sp. CE80]
MMTQIPRVVTQVNRFVASIAAASLLLLFATQFCVVLLRYVFDTGFVWMQELPLYFHGAAALLAIGYTLHTGGHIRVDIFYRSAGERRKALVDAGGSLLFLLPVSVTIFWYSLPYVIASWAVLERSAQPSGIPAIFVLKTLLPVFSLLLALQAFAQFWNACCVLFGAREIDPAALDPGAEEGLH